MKKLSLLVLVCVFSMTNLVNAYEFKFKYKQSYKNAVNVARVGLVTAIGGTVTGATEKYKVPGKKIMNIGVVLSAFGFLFMYDKYRIEFVTTDVYQQTKTVKALVKSSLALKQVPANDLLINYLKSFDCSECNNEYGKLEKISSLIDQISKIARNDVQTYGLLDKDKSRDKVNHYIDSPAFLEKMTSMLGNDATDSNILKLVRIYAMEYISQYRKLKFQM